MKKASFLFIMMAIASLTFAQTADEVINKFMEAAGGKDKLNAVNTLEYSQLITLKTGMGDIAIPIEYYKEKNKLYRMQASTNFAGQSLKFFTLINDTVGYVMAPAMPMFGSAGGLQTLKDTERKLQAYQLDAAGYFASLVDYAAKESKVEMLPGEKVGGDDCYKLRLTMSTGQSLTYFISKATNQVSRVDTKGDMAANVSGMGSMMSGLGGGVENMEVTALYSDYKDINGVKFPTKVRMKAPMGESESTITNIKVNEVIDPKYYKPE